MKDDDQDLYEEDPSEVEILEEDEANGESFGGAEFAGGLLLGAVLGVAITLLFAPQEGRRTRRDIRRRARHLRDDAEESWDDAQREVKRRLRRHKRSVKGHVDKAADRARDVVKRLN